MLSRIAVLEHENAQLAEDNARLLRPSPRPAPPEPVTTPPVEREPIERHHKDDDAGLFVVMFALYVVLKIIGLFMST